MRHSRKNGHKKTKHSPNSRIRSRSHSRSRHTHRRTHRGGYGPGSGPVGYAWTPEPMTWPGVAAANGANTDGIAMSNHLPLSPYGIAPGGVELAVPEIGYKGGRRRRHSRRHRGGKRSKRTNRSKKTRHGRRYYGGFGPQELINFGRDLKFQAMTAYDAFMGNEGPVNPSPLSQPINENYKVVEPTPVNLPRAFSLAGDSVAPI